MIGNTTLETAKVILDLGEKRATILGEQIDLHRAESGHFMVDVKHPEETSMRFLRVNEHLVLLAGGKKSCSQLDEKSLRRIHHYLEHAEPEKLKKLIDKSAGLLTPTVESILKEIAEDCSCRTIENRRPKPAVALPKADKHNQVVSLDLKEWKGGDIRYILYLIDVFSRITVGCFIKDKNPDTIVEAILAYWVRFFGRMQVLLCDGGGEFLNEDVAKLCEYLDMRETMQCVTEC